MTVGVRFLLRDTLKRELQRCATSTELLRFWKDDGRTGHLVKGLGKMTDAFRWTVSTCMPRNILDGKP
jgi:hypothetical protein